MKAGVNLHHVVSYGKKLVDNTKVLDLQSKINEERIYREKSTVEDGVRKLSEHDAEILKGIRKEINSLKRRIKKIEKSHDMPFKSLKKKRKELTRIIDKKKIYRVDVELDQTMTCFRISFANICAYLLDECFGSKKMTLERLFETIFELRGRVSVEDGQRNVFIERNPKQEYIMKKLESALCTITSTFPAYNPQQYLEHIPNISIV